MPRAIEAQQVPLVRSRGLGALTVQWGRQALRVFLVHPEPMVPMALKATQAKLAKPVQPVQPAQLVQVAW